MLFEFSNPIVIPANTPTASGCVFRFQVKILAKSSADTTPGRIENRLFTETGDASCDNGQGSDVLQSGGINTCPAPALNNGSAADCTDNNACTADVCNQTNGTCGFTDTVTSTCDDSNACTLDACNATTGLCTHTDTVTSTCDDSNACTNDSCDPATGVCSNVDNGQCQEGCPTSFRGPSCSIGAFANFAVLILGGQSCDKDVILSSPATKVEGDVGICAGAAGDILKLTVDGDLLIQDDGAGLDIHDDVKANSIQFNADFNLTAACGDPADGPGDCRLASQCASGQYCNQTISGITTNYTFLPGVTCITGNINTVKRTFTFNDPTAQYIINVLGAGPHILNNLTTQLLNGVQPSQILWNFTAVGTEVKFFKTDATLYGSVLVPDGFYNQDHGKLYGNVCAACVKLHSGAFVTCPEPTDNTNGD